MDIKSKGHLTVEQQFRLQVLSEQVENLSAAEAREYLLEMFRQQMVKDNLFKHMIKHA